MPQTGEGRPGYPALLAEALRMAGATEGLEAVLLSHHHYDHVGGLHQVRTHTIALVVVVRSMNQGACCCVGRPTRLVGRSIDR